MKNSNELEWIKYTPNRKVYIPADLSRDTLIKARFEDGYETGVIRADEVDWWCPGDQVTEYAIVPVPNSERKS